MAGEPRPTEDLALSPSARGRRMRIVDGRAVRARIWLLVPALLLAAGVALLGLRLALDAVAEESAPPSAPSLGASPR